MIVSRMLTSAGVVCSAAVLCVCAGASAQCGFDSENTVLLSHLDLSDFNGPPATGNDCWGYVSASGREYALMGLSNAVAVVEITDPVSPDIIGYVPHTGSPWSDIKTYGDYAYSVNEGGGGIDVIDLSDVDNGNVTHVQSVTANGESTSHNVAIDTTSGFLYLCDSNLNGGRLVAYDLSDPANPTLAGMLPSSEGEHAHDAQVVTYTSGKYAGKQIAFGATGFNGLEIYDVTDKSNMFMLASASYPNLSFAHQCWLSEDKQYLYLNDELDNVNETVIFDVTDLSSPFVTGSYDTGVSATDHNIYVHDGFIYEAEYHAGLRILDASDPLNPSLVGWLDTYPLDDGPGTDGAWGVYPFFPSGNIVVSDIEVGMFVARKGAPPISFDVSGGLPNQVAPIGETLQVTINAMNGTTLDPDSPQLVYDAGDGFVEVTMTPVGDNVYEATFPEIACGQTVLYYFSASTESGIPVTLPTGAPCETLTAISAFAVDTTFEDDMEQDMGWSAGVPGDDATAGEWVRVDPNGTAAQPEDDHTPNPGHICFVTGNGSPLMNIGAFDVDNGQTTLLSPALDLSGAGQVTISYWRWYHNDFELIDSDEGNAPNEDVFTVDVSDDDGDTWTNVETVGPDGPEVAGGWIFHSFRVEDFVELTSQVRVRFVASDTGGFSIVEAAVDDFRVDLVTCEEEIVGDLDGDGLVGVRDLLALLGAWGPCPGEPQPCPADLDGDGNVGVADLLMLLAAWT